MRLNRYPKYKESEVQWIGEIPEHWQIKPLMAVLKERNEKNDPIKTEQILSLSIAHGVTLYFDKGRGGNKAKSDLTAYKVAYPNDIVLNSMNVVVGAVGLSKYKGAISPVYYALYPRSNGSSVHYYEKIFKNSTFQSFLFIYGKGILVKKSGSGKMNTIRMKISMQDLRRTLLPVPSYDEQGQIVKYLNWKIFKINKFIRNKCRLIQLLKEQKQAIINDTVTRGINPDVKLKSSGIEWLGDIPEHWDNVPLRSLGRFQNGISESAEYFGSGYPFLNYGDVYSNMSLPSTVEGLAKSSEEERKRLSVQEGDIFFTRTSETIEEIGISSVCMENIKDAVFSGFLIRFRPIKNTLTKEFSKYYFRSYVTREFFVKEMNIVTRASLAQGLLKSLPVILPPSSEQIKIFDFLEATSIRIDSAIEKAQHQITLIQEYRKRLISDVVTGKVDVREIKVEDLDDEELVEIIESADEVEELEESAEEVSVDD